MNEIVVPPKYRLAAIRSFAKHSAWFLVTRWALHGLCTWDLEEHWMMIEEREMPLPGLGEGFAGATIAHISDLHCSPLMRTSHLRKYVEIINRLRPDFVVITGDFITATTRHYAREVAALLAELSPRVAALACLGNHDYGLWHPRMNGLDGLGQYLADQLESAGIRTLTNEAQTFRRGGTPLHFVGVGELWVTRMYNPAKAFDAVPPGQPVIALCHNPDAAPHLATFGADYILSGHRHGRELAPTKFNNMLFPAEHRHFIAGQYPLGDRRYVYVNRGLFHTRRQHDDHLPEITLFTLRTGAADEPAPQRADGSPIQRDYAETLYAPAAE